ncbi:MAG: deoxyribose-phosphate aldolase [Anaerolineae bacterium]|nr:deoxyribose-phosphate aldolase [Anaerolineae bacterium]
MTQTPITRAELAKMIDHSLLKPTVTRQDTIAGLEIALQYDVASATVKPCYVPLAAEVLAGSSVKVNPVVDFPFGYGATSSKAAQTAALVAEGAQEIDMVMNVGALLGGDYEDVQADIAAVVQVAGGLVVKVILEVAYLNDEQVVQACQLCEAAGAHFVKTSSGFAPAGYTLEVLRLMRASVSERVQVKAAHGVRSLEEALAVRAVGVTRFGATQTVKIMAEWDAAYGGESTAGR